MSSHPMQFASLSATYYAEPEVLRRQLLSIPEGWLRLVVDDGTPDAEWSAVEQMLRGLAGVEVVRLHDNVGLAAAQNAGMRRLDELGGVTHVLLLDQDSEPCAGAVDKLAAAYVELEREGKRVGAVGPTLIDPDTQVRHGFHVTKRGFWTRIHPERGPPVRCAGLNGSGTLMSLSMALTLNGMDESLFIDMVDAEWSFRVSAGGLALYGVPTAVFLHRMGVESSRIWLFGWRVWPRRRPVRNRYVFRNTIKLIRREYVPVVWKLWALVKLTLSLLVALATDRDRREQLVSMMHGVVDGVRNLSGKIR